MQVTNMNHFRNFWFLERQDQGVGWNDFSVLLHCHPADFNHTLISTNFSFGKFKQFTAPNHSPRGVQRLVHTDVYWPINKMLSTQKILSLDLLITLNQEGPIPQSPGALQGSGLPQIPSESQKETVWTGGVSSLADFITRNRGQLVEVKNTSVSESVSVSVPAGLGLLFLFF